MKKIIKNNFLGFVLGILLCGGIVYAVSYKASDIIYSSKNPEITNVNAALDDLYLNMVDKNRPIYLSYDYNSTSSTKRSLFVNKGDIVWYFTNATGCTTSGVEVSNYSKSNYMILLVRESGLLTITLNAATSGWTGGILRANFTNSFSNFVSEYVSTSSTSRVVNVNKGDLLWYHTNATGCTTSGIEVSNYSRDNTIILYAKETGTVTITLNAETSGWVGGVLKSSN